MFFLFLKTTIRNLYREKLYAAVNILGLSIGFVCCIALGLYLVNEIQYDSHHRNGDSLYRIATFYSINGDSASFATSSVALGPLLKLDNPEAVESYTRFRRVNSVDNSIEKTLFRHQENAYFWEDVYLVDDNVFEVFDHEIIYGNPESALSDPSSVAISESLARTYFGNTNPIGEVLTTDISQYRVTLVFEDLPENSHLRYDALLSMNLVSPFSDSISPVEMARTLGTVSDFTYVLMQPGFDTSQFDTMFQNIQTTRIDEGAVELGLNFSATFLAQNIADVHYGPDLDNDLPTGSILHLYGFATVLIFILAICCINYINLTTARQLTRARKMGICKILGANRKQLFFQLLGESLFFVFTSLIIALAVTDLLLEYNVIQGLIGQQIGWSEVSEPNWLLAMLAAGLILGMITGLYPAIYLSSSAPITALSENSDFSLIMGSRLRRLLVLVQFTISIGIISSTLLMSNQMRFVSDLSLGFDKDNKFLIPMRGADVIESLPEIRDELLGDPNILSVAFSQQLPGDQIDLSGWYFEDEEGDSNFQIVSNMFVGENFLETIGISIVQGRGFSTVDVDTSPRPFLVNQALVDELGWSQPIGKLIGTADQPDVGIVVGVTEDFHFESLYRNIGPLLMVSPTLDFSNASATSRASTELTLVVNTTGSDVPATLDSLTETMTSFDPIHPFEFEFLDQRIGQLYNSDQQAMKLITLFSAICVIISSLGLFGLSSFSTEQRKKEIGVRKVLGASSLQIIVMFCKNILPILLLGTVIASFASYLAINEWLNAFAYRDFINPSSFGFAAILASSIAFATIALQSYRTASGNPVDAIRYE